VFDFFFIFFINQTTPPAMAPITPPHKASLKILGIPPVLDAVVPPGSGVF
jgi:hypothetical protein